MLLRSVLLVVVAIVSAQTPDQGWPMHGGVDNIR